MCFLCISLEEGMIIRKFNQMVKRMRLVCIYWRGWSFLNLFCVFFFFAFLFQTESISLPSFVIVFVNALIRSNRTIVFSVDKSQYVLCRRNFTVSCEGRSLDSRLSKAYSKNVHAYSHHRSKLILHLCNFVIGSKQILMYNSIQDID